MGSESLATVTRLKDAGFIKTQGLINGKWIDAEDGKTIKVENPATGEVICNVACLGHKETARAISSAHEAFQSWSKLSGAERGKRLLKWYDLLVSHKEELGQLITLEQGKPIKEALGEVKYGANFVEFYAEESKRVYGDFIPSPQPDRRFLVLKQPVGVVGAITPWNFPLAMITRKVAPALACGCTVVVKPSELTPLSALAAAELALRAGIPPGAFNIVMGNASEIGETLLASSQVRKITFTGSTAVGKKLMAGAAETVKKVSLELGGNAPCVIFDDAELEVAVKGAIAAKFMNSGQTCICPNRVLVQEGIYDKFAEAFVAAVQQLRIGIGLTEGVTQGPLINEAAVQKVEKLILDAKEKHALMNGCIHDSHACGNMMGMVTVLRVLKGANVLIGGKKHSLGLTFYEPTVLADVKPEMLISREEIFGPVAPLLRFKTEDEAVEIANDTNAGLAAYLFTTDMSRSWRVAEALEYGLVGVNEGMIASAETPFGGCKQSGLGREGSKYGIDEYVEGANVLIGGKKHSLGLTFYEPTVLADVKPEMLISREEIFGPVAPLLRFKTEDEAVEIANDTNAGLAAYLFTTDMSRSWRVAEALEYGLVGVNEGMIASAETPFGGCKQSGLGREGSKYGIDEYVEIKHVCLGNMKKT